MTVRYIASFLAILLYFSEATGSASGQQYGGQQGLATIPLEVVSKAGSHKFIVELATTYEQQAMGMMYRTKIDPDKGMFFVYTEAERRSYWMKNVSIPLDIIYIRSDGRISNIIRNAKPHDGTPRYSRGKVLAVLEIAGGRARELGIRPGDKVLHRIFDKK